MPEILRSYEDVKKCNLFFAKNNLKPIYIGKPGIGKTEMQRQYANEMHKTFIQLSVDSYCVLEISEQESYLYPPDMLADPIGRFKYKLNELFNSANKDMAKDAAVVLLDDINLVAPEIQRKVVEILEEMAKQNHFSKETEFIATALPDTDEFADTVKPFDPYLVSNRGLYTPFILEPDENAFVEYFTKHSSHK